MLKKKLTLILSSLFLTSSCNSVYFKALEGLGYQKRDILVSRIEKAEVSQEKAKEQFKTTLEKFHSVLGSSSGKIENKYKELQAEYDKAENSSENVSNKIKSVISVGDSMFSEWQNEIEKFSDPELKNKSRAKYIATKKHYSLLVDTMRDAESKIAPVLTVLYDQVLYLKHSANAEAVQSVKGELSSIKTDVDSLIKALDVSINKAKVFIKQIDGK